MPYKTPDQDDTPRTSSMLRPGHTNIPTAGTDTTTTSNGFSPTKLRAPAPPPDTDDGIAPASGDEEQPLPKLGEEDPRHPIANHSSASSPPRLVKNECFQDLEKTGQWGKISKTEIYIVVTVTILVIVGVTLGLVFGLRENDDEERTPSAINAPSAESGTTIPTMAPTTMEPLKEMILAFEAIDYSDLTYLYQQELPLEVEGYEGLMNDPTATPQERAMSWLLLEDTRDVSTEVGGRWALASLYFGWKGEDWVSADNWLSSDHHVCEWEHINCDTQTEAIREIDLQSNNLVGTIPPEIVMLNTTRALWLRNNQLTGPLPNEYFGSMPQLSILYLDNNQLTGTIALSIRNNEVLNSLFVQSNNLIGEWPRLFCPFSSSTPASIPNFGIDCDEVRCVQQGCCSPYTCYYDNESSENINGTQSG